MRGVLLFATLGVIGFITLTFSSQQANADKAAVAAGQARATSYVVTSLHKRHEPDKRVTTWMTLRDDQGGLLQLPWQNGLKVGDFLSGYEVNGRFYIPALQQSYSPSLRWLLLLPAVMAIVLLWLNRRLCDR